MSEPVFAAPGSIQKTERLQARMDRSDVSRTDEDSDGCPFTTLYWDFLMRHEERLDENPRMGLQLYNLRRIESDERRAIRRQATTLRDRITAE